MSRIDYFQDDEELDPDELEGNRNKIYIQMSCYDAALKRIRILFDKFETIVVSTSGGKDSQVTFELAWREAQARGREIHLFFLDQEAEYQASIDVVKEQMSRSGVIPHWYQVPVRMTNATSSTEEFLHAWEPGAQWMRAKDPIAIHCEPGAPDRFYDFMNWFEKKMAGACFLVGLRAGESLNRFAATTRSPAIEGMNWTSKGAAGSIRAYPIYDWTFEDIWAFMGRERIAYNRIYDYMWQKGIGITEMRISFLMHEKSFGCLTTLQEFEFETYSRLIERAAGTHTAAAYADEDSIYSGKKLPKAFKNWLDYREFLLNELPLERQTLFRSRFANHMETVPVYKQQIKQLLINDWENNVPVVNMPDREDPRIKWMDIL